MSSIGALQAIATTQLFNRQSMAALKLYAREKKETTIEKAFAVGNVPGKAIRKKSDRIYRVKCMKLTKPYTHIKVKKKNQPFF